MKFSPEEYKAAYKKLIKESNDYISKRKSKDDRSGVHIMLNNTLVPIEDIKIESWPEVLPQSLYNEIVAMSEDASIDESAAAPDTPNGWRREKSGKHRNQR